MIDLLDNNRTEQGHSGERLLDGCYWATAFCVTSACPLPACVSSGCSIFPDRHYTRLIFLSVSMTNCWVRHEISPYGAAQWPATGPNAKQRISMCDMYRICSPVDYIELLLVRQKRSLRNANCREMSCL